MAILEEEKKVKSTYTPRGVYKDAGLSAADQAAIADLKRQWEEANRAGDQAGMDRAHLAAEAIRSGYGYSGGGDGSEYISVQKKETKPAVSRPVVNDYSSYIRQMNEATRKKALSELQSAYEQNVAALDRTKETISPQYRDARNQAAGQAALAKRQFAEYAAAHGLNSGAGGQAELSRSNALQSNLRALSEAESDAMADLELQRTQMQSKYNDAIRQANATGDYELAQQLYQEMVRQDQAMMEQIQQNAQQELARQQMEFEQKQAALSAQQWEREFQAAQQEGAADRVFRQQQADLSAQQWEREFQAALEENAADREFQDRKWAQQLQATEREYAAAGKQQEYENKLAMAKQLAAYGDFSGFAALGVDTAQMRTAWNAQEKAEAQGTQKSAGSESGKPSITLAQAQQLLEEGVINETTLGAYRYYTGQDYKLKRAQLSPEAERLARRYESRYKIDGTATAVLCDSVQKGLTDGTLTTLEADFLLELAGL